MSSHPKHMQEAAMSEQPTHAMLVRADDGSLHHRPACTSRECAERTITFAEGGQVVGVTYLYPEPIPGVQFWSAVQLGNAPKTAVDSASQWQQIAEANNLIASLQSMRDRLMPVLERFGDAFDGDMDVLLNALNHIKRTEAQP